MRMILILAATVAVGTATSAGCGASDESGPPVVAASTGILADISAAIGGDDVEVVQLIPDSASPHDFQPSAADRQRLLEADLVALNGGGLDASVPIASVDAPAWALTEHAPDLLPFAEGGADDPHVWMDPTRVAAALPSLADAFAEIDPGHAGAHRDRAAALAARLGRLDREIAESIDSIPPGDRELVTSHDALGYFADRYGLTVVATPFPATGAEAEPSAQALAEVIDAVEATDTPALFAEETDDPEVLESIGAETGATVVSDLLVESPGSAGSYVAMLRHDGELIAAALRD